ALRLGNLEAYLQMQRSATDAWLQQQDATFDHYQALKQTGNINLSGRIIATQIDGSRGRVQVEEIIDGVPYGNVWFYWRYDDGWRHVPPDYTFWGASQTVEAPGVLVRYQTVDQSSAQALAPRVAEWLRLGCAALVCGDLPRLTVEILPSTTLQAGWSANASPDDLWTLQLPSPYVGSARLDMPFDTATQITAANLIAERLVSHFTPTYPHDAYYLRQGIISWLVKRFAEIETNSFLISSLAEHYGDPAVGRLLQTMQPTSDADVIQSVTGKSLDTSTLDWRDFLTWRLHLEDELITGRDEASFLTLYDTADTTVRDLAYARYNSGVPGEARTVTAVFNQQGADGTPELRAVVDVGDPVTSREELIFRLVGGVWKRAN
ncbi:MAG: hypothetical protein ABI835_21350, partial [Chloroflexota bacterium]